MCPFVRMSQGLRHSADGKLHVEKMPELIDIPLIMKQGSIFTELCKNAPDRENISFSIPRKSFIRSMRIVPVT